MAVIYIWKLGSTPYARKVDNEKHLDEHGVVRNGYIVHGQVTSFFPHTSLYRHLITIPEIRRPQVRNNLRSALSMNQFQVRVNERGVLSLQGVVRFQPTRTQSSPLRAEVIVAPLEAEEVPAGCTAP